MGCARLGRYWRWAWGAWGALYSSCLLLCLLEMLNNDKVEARTHYAMAGWASPTGKSSGDRKARSPRAACLAASAFFLALFSSTFSAVRVH